MADPGRVKLAVPASVRRGTVARLRALVLHPQERVERQGGRSVERNYRFVNRVVVTYLGRDIVELEPSTAISENPSFTIPFRATETGLLKVTFFDTHGGRFEGTAEVTGTAGFTYVIEVTDKGEPGRDDTFAISLSNGYQASGTLGGGNIQLYPAGE